MWVLPTTTTMYTTWALPLPPSPCNRRSFLCPFHIPTHLASNLATANAWIGSTTATRRLEDSELGPSTTCAAPRQRCTLLCIEAFRTLLYVPYYYSVLEHRLVHNVHVYKPPFLAQSQHNHPQIVVLLSPPFPLVFASDHSLCPLQIPQPFKQLARSPLVSHRHTHTLFPSPPAVEQLTTANPPPHYSILSYPSFELTCGPSVCNTFSLQKITLFWGLHYPWRWRILCNDRSPFNKLCLRTCLAW